jgi:hydroxyethylthiazole kinase-like uncharacterized protein yjeF
MDPVLTTAEMRAFDRYAITDVGIPSIVLMENAGRGTVELMATMYAPLQGKSAVVVCGSGNNGGDGLVVARHLAIRGLKVTAIVLGRPKDLKGDVRTNYESLAAISKSRQCQIRILTNNTSQSLSVLPQTDFTIDAVFGTGFRGKIEHRYRKIIDWINGRQGVRISIDIPSGINGDTGEAESSAVRAHLTTTMAFKKIGLLVGRDRTYAGCYKVVDIGLPTTVLSSSRVRTWEVHASDIRSILPKRSLKAHKYSVGKVFVLAGSMGFTGAAAMTSTSVLRSGAGAAVLGTPDSVFSVLAKKLTEVIVRPLASTPEGTLSSKAIADIASHSTWANVILLGPGLSRNLETKNLVRQIVRESSTSILIDADGLNALAEDPTCLTRGKRRAVILTPHAGELALLMGMTAEDVNRDFVEVARAAARRYRAIIVAKGSPTVTASPDGSVYINSTGNPGMATVGTGDVLAGCIAGLWAQGMEPLHAAYGGVFIHGLAGDRASITYGVRSMIATDVQELLPQAMMDVEGGVA